MPINQLDTVLSERTAFALKASGIGIWDVDLGSSDIWMDENCRSIFGIADREEIRHEKLLKSIHPDDRDWVQKEVTSAFIQRLQTKLNLEFRVIATEHSVPEWISCKGTIYYQDEAAYRFSGTAHNISKQKRAEEDAVRFGYMTDHARDAFILMRQDGSFAYLNQMALERWGYTAQEALSLRVPDVDPIYNDQLFTDLFARAQREKIQPFETVHKKKDGSVYDVEVNVGGFRLGQEHYMLAIAHDITDRKISRQLLDENQLRLQSIVAAAPIGIALFTGRDQIIEMPNQAFIDLIGQGQDIPGKSARQVLHGFELNGQPFPVILEQVFLSGKALNHAAWPIITDKTGNEVTCYYDISQIPIRDSNGEINAILFTSVDVTDSVLSHQQLQESETRFRLLSVDLENLVNKRTEDLAVANQELVVYNEELSTINEELTASNQQIVTANERLAESNHLLTLSNESLDRFAFVASHDLQEPLRKIQQFGDLLMSRYADRLGDGVTYLERMQYASGRMSTLIKDLLVYSGIASKKEPAANISLEKVIDTVLSDLDLRINETMAVISVERPLPAIKGIVSEIEQLFQNLLNNAIKFSKPDQPPQIRISHHYVPGEKMPVNLKAVRQARVYHCIQVKDNGIGFDQQYVDRIFQVFERLNGKSEFAGTGIGLAICDKVVVNHGGAITASSSPGKGATFSIYLPI
jgi:PAS domain S-box-containing protein